MTSSRDRVMKDSGVDWIGRIPESWQVGKFRHLYTESKEVNGKNPVGEMLSVSGYRGVELKEYSSDSLKRDQEDLETYRVVRPGQLAVNTMWLNYAGLGVSELIGHVSPAYRSYWIDEKLNPRFAHHLMRSQIYVNAYTGYLTGVRPNSLQMSRENLMNWPILLPEMSEQQAIAEFLDRETAQIDSLIEKQQQLIRTVAERRQSVISTAVTRGIDKNVPVKYSGLPWLGDIPENWNLKPLKSIATLNPEVLPENTDEDLPIRYIEISNVSLMNGVEGWTETKFGEAPSRARRVIRPRDVLISTVRTYLRAIGMVREVSELGFDVASTGFAALRAKSVNSDFLELAITAEYFVSGIEAASVGVSYPGINSSQIMSMRIPVPPLDIQEQISVHVRSLIAELDILKDKTEKMIDVLKERRQALISAAVTGKIDVRGK